MLGHARDHIARNRRIVSQRMERQELVDWVLPEAGVVGLARIKPGVRLDPERLYRLLASKYKTFVIPGRCFELDNRYFRLGFGATPSEIEAGLANVDIALAECLE